MKFPKLWGRSAAPVEAEAAPAEAPRRKFFGSRSLAQMFKASVTSNSTDAWGATPVSPDVFISQRQPVLVARSREQWSNNDYVRAFIRLCRQNIVGPQGITLQSKARKVRGKGYDKDANDAIEAAWAAWGKPGNCEVTGKLSWRAIQNLVVETCARDGEFIARKIYGADAGPFGFALQLLDPQRLSVKYENYQHGGNGNFVRQGIEFNRYGKPAAYHFTSTDEWDAYYYSINGKGFVRIPADQIIHGYAQEMVGQRRGLPWTSTSLFRLHHLQGFEDAAVQNARAGASKMGFFQYRDGFGPTPDDPDQPIQIDAEPLSFHELPEGAEFVDFNPQYPSGEFALFSKAMLRGAAAGMGVLYNNMASDLEGVNFSSIRQGTLDERERWKELQQWLIEALAEPVFDEWLKLQLLAGRIKTKNGRPLPADKIDTYRCVSWQARRWAWIDPRADVDSAIKSIRAGLTSPSQVIREQGRDPETVFTEIAEDLQQMKAAGISEDAIAMFMTGEPPAPEAEASETATTEAE